MEMETLVKVKGKSGEGGCASWGVVGTRYDAA